MEDNDYILDEMELEQELINNYWQMPLPKSSSTVRSTTRLEAFAFNEVIATNNRKLLDEISDDTAKDFDELLDKAMEQNGEVCSILDIVRSSPLHL